MRISLLSLTHSLTRCLPLTLSHTNSTPPPPSINLLVHPSTFTRIASLSLSVFFPPSLSPSLPFSLPPYPLCVCQFITETGSAAVQAVVQVESSVQYQRAAAWQQVVPSTLSLHPRAHAPFSNPPTHPAHFGTPAHKRVRMLARKR